MKLFNLTGIAILSMLHACGDVSVNADGKVENSASIDNETNVDINANGDKEELVTCLTNCSTTHTEVNEETGETIEEEVPCEDETSVAENDVPSEEITQEEVIQEEVIVTYPIPINKEITLGDCKILESWPIATDSHFNIVFAAECLGNVRLYNQRADLTFENWLEEAKIIDICEYNPNNISVPDGMIAPPLQINGISQRIQEFDNSEETIFWNFGGNLPENFHLNPEKERTLAISHNSDSGIFSYNCDVRKTSEPENSDFHVTIQFHEDDLDSENTHNQNEGVEYLDTFAQTIMPLVNHIENERTRNLGHHLARWFYDNWDVRYTYMPTKTDQYMHKYQVYQTIHAIISNMPADYNLRQGISSEDYWSNRTLLQNPSGSPIRKSPTHLVDSSGFITGISNGTSWGVQCFQADKRYEDYNDTTWLYNHQGSYHGTLPDFDLPLGETMTVGTKDAMSMANYSGDEYIGLYFDHDQQDLYFIMGTGCYVSHSALINQQFSFDDDDLDISFADVELIEDDVHPWVIQEVIGTSSTLWTKRFQNEIWIHNYAQQVNSPYYLERIKFEDQYADPTKAHFEYVRFSERENLKNWVLVTSGSKIIWHPLKTNSEANLIDDETIAIPEHP